MGKRVNCDLFCYDDDEDDLGFEKPACVQPVMKEVSGEESDLLALFNSCSGPLTGNADEESVFPDLFKPPPTSFAVTNKDKPEMKLISRRDFPLSDAGTAGISSLPDGHRISHCSRRMALSADGKSQSSRYLTGRHHLMSRSASSHNLDKMKDHGIEQLCTGNEAVSRRPRSGRKKSFTSRVATEYKCDN